MTMLWLSGSGEMTVVRSHRNERMFYACNPNVTVTRAPSLRIQVLQAELRGVLLKRRADDSDDDPGLPHSPSSPSTPPATSRHQAELKGQSGKSGGSCSDGSLLSMYSSGTCTDDDIFGPLSKHPSRASLGRDAGDGLDLETTAALSHSAAKHRIAVRPRRTHGAPRQRRSRAPTGPAATGLPPTVEEESPPATPTAKTAVSSPTRPVGSSPLRLSPERTRRAPSASPSRSQSIRTGSPEVSAAAPVTVRPTQVKRSKSSVADGRIRDVSPRKFWSRDPPPSAVPTTTTTTTTVLMEEDRKTDKAETFFSRIFGSRRSGRKKKDDRSLSPETVIEPVPAPVPTPALAPTPAPAPVPVPSRRPPTARHRSHFGGGGEHRGSPASAMHADIIRPPSTSTNRAAELAEPRPAEFVRASEPPRPAEPPSRGAEVPRAVDLLRSAEASRSTEPVRPVSEMPRPTEPVRTEVPRPPADALRRGPAFLADVRAEVAALAGGDRGDDSVTVSPQVLRRHRASAAAAVGRPPESPRVRPRLVGLTAYQQRLAHMQRSPSPEPVTGPAARRSFSCENVGEEDAGSRGGSGMALDRVLGFIKSTSAAATAERQPVRSEVAEGRAGSEESEAAPSAPVRPAGRRESTGSPGAGPKSLDSSLFSSTAEPPSAAPSKAVSVESVQSGGQERTARGAAQKPVPEFLRVQLHKVDGHQRDSAPPAVAERRDSGRDSGRNSGRNSAERESSSSPAVSEESPPVLRRPVSAARQGSPELRRRPSQARSRGSGSDAEPPVVLRPKTAPASEDSELLKVFKRRSLKSRDPEDLPAVVAAEPAPAASRAGDGEQKTSRPAGGDEKENEQPRDEAEETVVCASVPASPPRRPLPAGRTGPAEESEPPRRVSIGRRDSEAGRRASGQEDEAARPAGWLKQAVRERREQREQREQKHVRPAAAPKELLIESDSGSSGRSAGPSRSSRVLEMANTFQKLQTT
ncbi:serine/arginine repetitive matrix protein 1-like isoform X2 [Amphibalanus amphitrite]|uniref:serine/arginine repetitive matrix protein 1-like isoform X2 n=1 Tax=Amphibalanus amphitrite TaxID=1232801 RepID=UPI001C8FA984|nr:serine/arginine repetitive matrix protein 1-like isoform X2 [Amphibalanus amphitrite]